jgi:sigma-B regulation protein RsbU (phosphoserine phosphatase)
MSDYIPRNRIEDLKDSLEVTLQEAGQIQTVVERTVQALTSRGVQVLVDYDGMFQSLRLNLDKTQRTLNLATAQMLQMQELIHTSALITSSLDLDQVLQEVMDTVIKLTRAERAYLMLKHGDELKVHSARNDQRETLKADDVTFSHGIIQTAIDSGAPLVTTNAQTDDRFSGMKSVFTNELRSIIIVPLILKGTVIGVLYADNRIEQGVFSQENIPLLTAFANQASIAISNARLFEKVKDDLAQAQQQVRRLQIEIDQTRLQEKVTEITDSDYFQYLTAKAKDLRDRGASGAVMEKKD